MDMRAAKLALARKKLKDHQENKIKTTPKSEYFHTIEASVTQDVNTSNECGNVTFEADEKCGTSESMTKLEESKSSGTDVNVTDILVSNKLNLEDKLAELQLKFNALDSAYEAELKNHDNSKQQVSFLQSELKDMIDKYGTAMENKLLLEKCIEELNATKTALFDEKNNLMEQLDLTKSILTSKETENTSLQNQLHLLQNELDFTKLQLQQLTGGSNECQSQNNSESHQIEELLQKINNLEDMLKTNQKEKDQLNLHYEQYVRELNEQLKSAMFKNEEFSKTVHNLSIRECGLIEQITEMELRLQSLQINKDQIIDIRENGDQIEIQSKYTKAQNDLQDIMRKYEELSHLYTKSQNALQELQEKVDSNGNHDSISISKLTADIASDKIAAQRATEQNKKLKCSIQELEESFVKMTQDKLELTEKLAAEKFLNRELTIKLAEFEEKSKDLHIKLRAKDEEMIRLQMINRELEKRFENNCTDAKQIPCHADEGHEESIKEAKNISENNELLTCNNNICLNDFEKKENIPKEDAMVRLQERFMKIMGEVADLSDEKHRLEHIILQLQNETDTICEYVALYQQQRSLLKKRDEERNSQIKLFQIECDRLKTQLEELSRIILKFAEDKELSVYFQVEHRKNDMEKIRNLLVNLKNSTLVDPKTNLELSNVYPCNCCSGNLIDV